MQYPESKLYLEFVEVYGKLVADTLDEIMGVIGEVEDRRLSGTEAKVKVLHRARQLLHEHVPASHEPRAAYDAREAEARRQEGELRARNYEEQERRRIAEAIRQKNSEELAAQRRRDAAAEEARKLAEYRAQFEQEERAKQAERDRQEQDEETREREVSQ